MKKLAVSARILMFLLSVTMFVAFSTYYAESIFVYANSLEDDLSGNSDDEQSPENNADIFGDFITRPVINSDQMAAASDVLSPVTNVIGYICGGLMILIFALSVLITGLDLLFLAVPPIRGLLYKGGQGMAQGGGYGRGGYGRGGYGGYGGGYGGYGGGYGGYGAGGMQQENLGIGGRITQFISDEAAMCASIAGDAPNPQMQSGQPQPQNKSVMLTYFKKRIISILLLVISAIVLTSSSLIGCGVNLAKWGVVLIEMLSDYIPV